MSKLFTCFVLGLLVAASHAASFESRIVGGSNAAAGQFPYMATLQTTAGAHFCAGVIINQNWLLTVAHCTVGRAATAIQARIGTITRVTGGTVITFSQIVNHPQYNVNNLQNDIALLRTSTPITFNANTQPTNVPTTNLGTGSGFVSGWGVTSANGPLADVLQFKPLEIISNQECINYHLTGGLAGMIVDSKICAVSPDGIGTCNGDSGSSLSREGVVYGLVSWGAGCATALPDIYTRVFSFRDWIISTAV